MARDRDHNRLLLEHSVRVLKPIMIQSPPTDFVQVCLALYETPVGLLIKQVVQSNPKRGDNYTRPSLKVKHERQTV